MTPGRARDPELHSMRYRLATAVDGHLLAPMNPG